MAHEFGTMKSFENRFRHHMAQGLRLECALDIGAYRGSFSRLLSMLWPGIRVWQFEADERQRQHNPNAIYALLGDSERECTFYTVDETQVVSTGSSIYRENTQFYRDPIVLKKQMTTIDKLSETIDFSGNWLEHGLVKLDTQGSELDILHGACGFLGKFQPRLMLLEVSILRYNEGSPLMAEVVGYMKKIGYLPLDVFELQYTTHGALLQLDLLFQRADI